MIEYINVVFFKLVLKSLKLKVVKFFDLVAESCSLVADICNLSTILTTINYNISFQYYMLKDINAVVIAFHMCNKFLRLSTLNILQNYAAWLLNVFKQRRF